MTIVVVDKAERVVSVFAGEAERVGLGDVEGREGRVGCRGSDGSEWRVFVMRGNAAGGLVGDKVGDVLVPVVEVEEVIGTRRPLHPQGPRRDRLGRIPAEGEVDRVVRSGIEPLDAEIAVVDEAVVRVSRHRHDEIGFAVADDALFGGCCFKVFDPAAHAVEGHHDVGGATRPGDRSVLAVIGDGPVAGRGANKRLVAVKVELRHECLSSGCGVGNRGILVKAVRLIDAAVAEVQRGEAVADVVVLVGVFVQRRVLDRVRKLAAIVVAVDVAARLGHARARARDLRAASEGVARFTFKHSSPAKAVAYC